MKKVLFATTALVATAGVASADIALSGFAEMGINGGSDTTTEFFQDLDVTFTMSGTADNGLTFGASVDLDESTSTAAFNPNDDGGTSIFISGEFGTLTLGDTDGALDWALQEVNYNGAGSIADDETSHAGYSGNGGLDGWYDGQILRYDYSFGDFAVAISVEQDDDTNDFGLGFDIDDALDGVVPGLTVPNNTGVTADPVWGLGAKYNGAFAGGTFGVGIGYQWTADGADFIVDNAITCLDDCGLPDIAADGVLDATGSSENASVWGVSANVALDSGFSAAINYSYYELDLSGVVVETGLNPANPNALPAAGPAPLGAAGDLSGSHWGIGGSYTFDMITVHANYGQYDWNNAANNLGIADASGYGLAAAYDFGGGLSAHLGYGYSDVSGGDDSHSYSFGLAMSF